MRGMILILILLWCGLSVYWQELAIERQMVLVLPPVIGKSFLF